MSWNLKHCLVFCSLLLVAAVTPAVAQPIEMVGSRAMGMGGAFVAVANDGTATWWNPAGLAAGPFVDVSLARAVTEARGELPAHRGTAGWLALGTPPFGFSIYRLRFTEIRPFDSTVTQSGSREDRRAGVPVQSLATSQYGITLVQTLIPGLHAGATLKYVRGTVRTGREDGLLPAGTLLDLGDDLEGGEGDQAFGADVGVLGVAGALRAGLTVRNAVEAELESADAVARLDRQVRAGVAYDAEAIGGPPLVVAVDADVTRLRTASGERRNVAVGVERWLWTERLGLRGGARVNTVGARERAATAGVSLALRAGLFLDAHAVGGGSDDERGWGVAARVSF